MKLEGIKVVDLSLFLPGPQMTAMMADHGAQVLKVEPLSGDPSRHFGPFEADHSVWFRTLNRGKSSVALDLKSDDGLQRLYKLVEQADVFVEAFRPGVVDRLKVDYDTLSAINPRLVYCSISAFGQNGPLQSHPAHDMAVQAYAGYLSVNDDSSGSPVVPGVAASDMAASLTALSAVLMAIIGREKFGHGDYLDIAMYDSILPWCAHTAGHAIASGEKVISREQRSLGGAAFYQVYTTADQRHLVLGGREEKFVRNLLNALERPDLIDICLGEAGEAQRPAVDFFNDTFSQQPLDYWVDWFEDKDVCFAPVLDFAEAFTSEQCEARNMLITGADGEHVIGSPIRFAREPAAVTTKAPKLNEHQGKAF
jgi:crotonobetainyl-CoA:carnitine CoA-transferase CaiB-like acyl-CoA transferase